MKPARIVLSLAVASVLTAPALGQQIISTFAGRDWVFPTQTEAATSAPLSAIDAVATDGVGNIYIPDPSNGVVVKVDRNGNSSVFAGNGIFGYAGDGGPATSASLASPSSVVVDSAGNVYISDEDNHRIRKVNSSGVITTFAGTGTYGHTGDGGAASNAEIEYPEGLAIGPGNSLYVIENDTWVRMIDSNGVVHTVAGNGTSGISTGDGGLAINATFNAPTGIAVDSAGNIYITEFYAACIRKVNTQGTISTFAGTHIAGFSGDGGPATSAQLNGPWGVAVDPNGNVFVSDTDNEVVRKISSSGVISTVAGTALTNGFSGDGGLALGAKLFFPDGIAADGQGNLWIADSGNLKVRRFTVGGNIGTVAGNALFRFTPDASPVSQMYLLNPYAIAFDNKGGVIIADTNANALRLVQANGQVMRIAGVSTVNGHSADGTAATALLDSPTSVAVAKDGTIYFAEFGTNLVRKITTAGALVTVAGTFNNFSGGFAGDGGPATKALLNEPFGVALDSKGNLYISDLYNQRIRKVDLTGNISTYAGSGGNGGFSGDGAPATAAQLNFPSHITFDSNDNLYIADTRNNRIRKVSAAGGTISTFANVPLPRGLVFDGAGNLYVSSSSNNKVLRVGTDGTVSTVAGNGLARYSGDGGLATTASLSYPVGLAVDSTGVVYIADSDNNRIRTLLTAGPVLSISTTTLNLTGSAGTSSNPSQSVAISAMLNNVPQTGLAYTVTTSTPWLSASINPISGTIPQNLTVSADATTLTAGQYTGSFTVAATGATPPSYVVKVNLTVASPNPPQLSVGSQGISVSANQGGTPTSSSVTLSNTGGGTISFQASATTPTGQSWLTVTPSSGQITNSTPVTLTVTATPGQLTPSTYSGAITITSMSDGSPVVSQVPVTLLVTQSANVILLSQTGLTFTAIAGGGNPLSQNFGILNTGQGSMNWSATATSPSGDSVTWLSLSASSGTVNRPYLDVSLLDVSVNPSGLTAGDYYAQIQVMSPAANSPQTTTVLLTVKPAGTVPSIEIQPSGLIFTGTASNPPGSQTVRLGTQASSTNSFRANSATFDGAPWLVSVPGTGSVTPAQGSSITVQPNYTGLNPGVYFGTVTFLFGDNTSRVVNVLTVIAPPNVTGNAVLAASCSHTQVQFQLTSTQPSSDGSFPAPVGQPLKLQYKVAYTCDATPFTTGSLAIDFQGGQEPHLVLTHTGNGVWETTWTPTADPTKYPSEQVIAQATWINGTTPAAQQSTVNKANLVSGTTVPVIKTGGVVSATVQPGSSQAAGLGGLVTIFGTQMATGATAASALPLQTNLAGTTVLLQGRELPLLYVSPGQINLQIPYDVTPNVSQSLLVNRNGALSASVPLAVASVQPSIFVGGNGQGVIVDSNNVIKDPTSPASPGSVVTIYCTGLGPVTPAVASGVGAPGPTSLVTPATVTIGGQNAAIQYAGLTPGSPGLYQINALVPSGVTGDTVPVVVSVGTQNSPAATMAIH